ncbi:hypothetical protein CIT292_08894 [Citrobacter youngae ATCC 29220]|uniref:Uncharacterized protein n=1 Tax=Citrobacter youngae ATCC 29220 TaxID=500640 RepID=D4BEG1_9ENTR|nr:hypothetical protein CIT292_08894 [Citrobacter youngae ATCC 29220]
MRLTTKFTHYSASIFAFPVQMSPIANRISINTNATTFATVFPFSRYMS